MRAVQPGAGVYIEAVNEVFDNTSVEYLLNNMDLDWERFKFVKEKAFPNETVLLRGTDYAIGRINKDGVTYVGKVMKSYGFYYAANGTTNTVKRLEILTCKKGKKRTNGRTILLNKILN